MGTLLKKLKNTSGETIGETLVALLISALALVMLAGAISAATGIITRSSDKIDEYYAASNILVTMSGTSEDVSSGSSSITVDGTTLSMPVKYCTYNGFKTPVTSFKITTSGD